MGICDFRGLGFVVIAAPTRRKFPNIGILNNTYQFKASRSGMLRLALLLGAAASCLAVRLNPELDTLRFNQIQGYLYTHQKCELSIIHVNETTLRGVQNV